MSELGEQVAGEAGPGGTSHLPWPAEVGGKGFAVEHHKDCMAAVGRRHIN